MSISIAAESLFHIGSFPVTNSMVVAWVMSAVLIAFGCAATRQLRMIPVGLQNIFETVIDGVCGMMESILGSRESARRFFPLVATIFLFILAVNWTEVLPGLGSVGIREVHEGKQTLIPFLRSTSADLNFTLMLSLVSVATVQIAGIASVGFFKYAGTFFSFKNPLAFFVGILELISEVAKIISFSFRLFGNIFAGEVLLIVIGTLVPYFLPLPFLALEIFVGLIQAAVFALLTTVFLRMAMEKH